VRTAVLLISCPDQPGLDHAASRGVLQRIEFQVRGREPGKTIVFA
jgi:hypothetical protein